MVVTSHLPEVAFDMGSHHPAPVEKRVHYPAAAENPLGVLDALLVTYREQELSREALHRAQDVGRERFVREVMSPAGPVADPPRVDRFPHLQIDVDVASRSLKFWEGDMWKRRGAGRATGPFRVEALTTDAVERRAVDVVRRVVALDAIPAELDS